MSDEPSTIKIDEVVFLRRAVQRLEAQLVQANREAVEFAALSDMQAAEINQLKETNQRLSDTLAAQSERPEEPDFS